MLILISIVLKILSIIVPLLISVAYFTIAERKLMGSIQRRRGPNVIGFLGLLQPLADGLKLFVKETIFPSNSNIYLFILAPLLTFILSLIGWAVIPLSETVVVSDLNLGVLYLFAISSLSVYGIILAGWSSNSKYPFLGSLRSAAQMISYEVSIGFIVITVVVFIYDVLAHLFFLYTAFSLSCVSYNAAILCKLYNSIRKNNDKTVFIR